VISNIVLNAVEATPNGGKIDVSAKNVTAPPVNLLPGIICASPCGTMALGYRRNICRAFTIRFSPPKNRRAGLGLRLPTPSSSGTGHIAVDSNDGSGTTVTFHLYAKRPVTPVIEPAPDRGTEPAVAKVVPEAPSNHEKLRVLVMDDDDAIRMLSEIMFKQLGMMWSLRPMEMPRSPRMRKLPKQAILLTWW